MSGDRVYARLLWLYPPAFRRRFGAELQAFHRRHRDDPRFAGRGGAFRFWRHTLADLLATAGSEWFATLSGRTGAEDRLADEAGPGGAGRPAGVIDDLRYGVRSLVRDPVFTLVAIVTLGLGIGATTSVFSVVRGVLLEPLGFRDEHQLVRVYEYERDDPGARMVAYGNYADLRDAALFDDLAIWAFSSHTLTGVDRALELRTREVSGNFARTLGVRPQLGRWIGPDEERLGHRTAVLAHGLWQRVFGGSEGVLGRAVLLDGEPYEVVGVMAPGFDYPSGAEAWVPLAPVTSVAGQRRWHRHNMVGRLRAGVTYEDMNRRLAPFAQALEEAYPETNAGNYFEARPLLATVVGQVGPALRVLFGAVAVLLLIACVNIAGLSHARSLARERELAVRVALGASAYRLGRRLLVESVVLAIGGGLLGLLVAQVGMRAAVALSAGAIPRIDAIAFNAPVFGFAACVAVFVSLAVATIPLLHLRRRSGAAARALHGGRGSAGARAVRGRRALVTAELALALVLTVGAGLLVRSFNAMVNVDPGIELDQLVALDMRVPRGERYATPETVAGFVEDLMGTLETLPGVARAAAMLTAPLNDQGWNNTLTVRDRPVAEADRPGIRYNAVSSGYFETIGARVLEGRTFARDEPRGGRRVGVINRAAARLHWPEESAIGKLVLGDAAADSQWVEIVGVIDDVRQSITDPARPEIYVPVAQETLYSFTVLARGEGVPVSGAALEAAIRRSDPDVPIAAVGPLPERVGALTARPRFSATLMGSFAGVALVLACVGVFGLLAFTVAERRREFGIRMALGARSGRVLASVLRDAVAMSALAVFIGLAGSLALSRLMTSLLFGVGPTDVVSFAGAAAAIVGVTLVAALWPARAATSVDPMAALREE